MITGAQVRQISAMIRALAEGHYERGLDGLIVMRDWQRFADTLDSLEGEEGAIIAVDVEGIPI